MYKCKYENTSENGKSHIRKTSKIIAMSICKNKHNRVKYMFSMTSREEE